MVPYIKNPFQVFDSTEGKIASFITSGERNIDFQTVSSFGKEWKKFDRFSDEEIETAGRQYFDIVSEKMLNNNSLVLDIGTGSGRWAKYVSPRAKFIEAIDPGDAVFSAIHFLKPCSNIRITQASVSDIPFADHSFDFIFSLGVFHHLPDTEAALASAVKKLKPGGYFLIYLYYSLDNRGIAYRLLFRLSALLRMPVSLLPSVFKKKICDLIALFVYLPLVTIVRIMKKVFGGHFWKKLPLSYYADKTFWVMRNDALDRFGTPLEKRFSKKEIKNMMEKAGLKEIVFSENEPFWHAVGKK